MRYFRTLKGDPKLLLSQTRGGLDVLRLMVATNLLTSLHRHAALRLKADLPPEERSVCEFGDMVAVIAFTAGVLKEGVDAFWCAEPYLTPLVRKHRQRVDASRYEQFQRDAAKSDEASVFCRLIRPIRDEAAFHWKRDRLAEYLGCITNADADVMRLLNDGETVVTARYTVADLLIALVMFGNESNEAMAARTISLREFVNLFLAVIEEVVALYLLEHGAAAHDRPVETPAAQSGGPPPPSTGGN